jgi:hypothetical protein
LRLGRQHHYYQEKEQEELCGELFRFCQHQFEFKYKIIGYFDSNQK